MKKNIKKKKEKIIYFAEAVKYFIEIDENIGSENFNNVVERFTSVVSHSAIWIAEA